MLKKRYERKLSKWQEKKLKEKHYIFKIKTKKKTKNHGESNKPLLQLRIHDAGNKPLLPLLVCMN
jgi:hypothetical protein